jgi:uncharacterized DUF497 family protein
MPKRHVYQFEWDPVKAIENVKKHNVAFDRAATVFLDAAAASIYDDEHSEDEDRWITLGIDRIGIILVVSHTFREQSESSARIRLISARKATKKEITDYRRK